MITHKEIKLDSRRMRKGKYGIQGQWHLFLPSWKGERYFISCCDIVLCHFFLCDSAHFRLARMKKFHNRIQWFQKLSTFGNMSTKIQLIFDVPQCTLMGSTLQKFRLLSQSWFLTITSSPIILFSFYFLLCINSCEIQDCVSSINQKFCFSEIEQISVHIIRQNLCLYHR